MIHIKDFADCFTQGKDSEKLFCNSFTHALFDLLSIYCTPDIVLVAEVTVTSKTGNILEFSFRDQNKQ